MKVSTNSALAKVFPVAAILIAGSAYFYLSCASAPNRQQRCAKQTFERAAGGGIETDKPDVIAILWNVSVAACSDTVAPDPRDAQISQLKDALAKLQGQQTPPTPTPSEPSKKP